jgi:hypothetical protein
MRGVATRVAVVLIGVLAAAKQDANVGNRTNQIIRGTGIGRATLARAARQRRGGNRRAQPPARTSMD